MDYEKIYCLQNLKASFIRAEQEIQQNPTPYRKETSDGVEYHIIVDLIATKDENNRQIDEIAKFFGDENISYYYDEDVGEYIHIRSSLYGYSRISDDYLNAWKEIETLAEDLARYLCPRVNRQFLKKVYFGFEGRGNWGLIAAYSASILNLDSICPVVCLAKGKGYEKTS